MTQILTAACPSFIVQVSDRLVVALRGHRIDVHDPVANKTIVYRAADALVTIGYSGIAYVGDTPTDEWIAETLVGESLRLPGDDRPSKRFGGAGRPLRIGHAVKRLMYALDALPRHPVERHGLYISLAGWQGDRKGARPIMEEIWRHAGKARIKRQEREWSKNANFRIDVIGAPPPDGTIDAALAPHRADVANVPFGPNALEDALASVIRQSSAAHATVGSHLLSVVLMRPDLGIAGCRFLPMAPHGVEVTTASGRRLAMPAAHTPWILGPGLVHPPSLEIGHSIIGLGGIEFHIFGAEPSGNGVVSLSSSLRRPRPPGR